MKTKENRILELAKELGTQTSYENYENLLDEMTLAFVSAENCSERTKGEAYLMVMNLKKLLKETCNDPYKILTTEASLN